MSLLLTFNLFNNTELINVVLLFLFWTDIYPVAMTTEYQEEMFLMAKKTSFQYLHLADRAQNFNSWWVNETILPPVHLVPKILIAGERVNETILPPVQQNVIYTTKEFLKKNPLKQTLKDRFW